MSSSASCSVCNKQASDTVTIQRCSRCHSRPYCGSECQLADWPAHKRTCGKASVWYDKHRKCRDGNLHEGKLELITWDNEKEGTGWGNCFKEESDDLRRKFEVEFGGDESKLFEYWPQGFRWTCCGMDGAMDYGCDHHGTGSKPCTCDFCRMGKPLPDRIYFEKSASRHGLKLPRGPDPRSYNVALAGITDAARTFLGMAQQ